jgi:RNA recognition motif-containing protein
VILFKLSQSAFDIECVDDLREFFEVNYGPVKDAVVIGSQAGVQMQSRGFGFVTFKHAASVSAAVELDHVSLGFEKLSDFVRSFPELCRMKIVPVGRGPATHMVLLPPHTRTNPSVATRRNLSNIATRSLVDGTRSYAEVACHGSAARLCRPDTVPSSHPAFCTGGTNLVRQGTHTGVPSSSGEMISSTDGQPPISFGLRPRNFASRENGTSASYAAAAGYNAGLISTSNGPLRTSITRAEGHSRSDSSNGTTLTSNSNSSNRGRSGSQDTETVSAGEISSSDVNSGLSEEDLGLLQES